MKFRLNFMISIREIKEVVSGVVILSHWVTSGDVINESWGPSQSDPFFVEMVDEPSVNKVLFESSKHEVEVEVLIGWGSWVYDAALIFIVIFTLS